MSGNTAARRCGFQSGELRVVAIRAKSTVIGLDVGASSVKLIALAHQSATPSLVGISRAEIPTGKPDSKSERTVEAVRTALAESGIELSHRVSVVSAIGGARVSIKHVTFPKMGPEELAESLKWEAKKHVPFKSSDFVVDFQLMDNDAVSSDDSLMHVLLAAAEQSAIDEHLAVLQAAGIEPAIVDLAPLGLMNEADAEGLINGRAVAIMELDESTAGLSMYKRGGFFFSRSIGIPSTAGKSGWVEQLLKEVRLSLTFYNNETGKQGIERMLLAGGRAKVSGIAESIQDATGVDTDVLDPLRKLRGVDIDLKAFEKHGPSFALAMGLARRR